MTTAGIIICTLSAASAFGAVIGGCILVANRWAERQADEFLRGLLARDREFEDLSLGCAAASSPHQFAGGAREQSQAVPVAQGKAQHSLACAGWPIGITSMTPPRQRSNRCTPTPPAILSSLIRSRALRRI